MNHFIEAFNLLLTFDREAYAIIGLSILVTLTSTAISAGIGIPFGLYLGLKAFPFKRAFTRLLNTLMSLPPVVIGLLVAIALSRSGPLGGFQLLFTPTAMVIAQTLLVTPIVMGIVYNHTKAHGKKALETGKTLGANRIQLLGLMIRETKTTILIALITGFGRAISEVGAVMIVGGNIKNHTRVMTTYIAMNSSMGNYGMSLAMGIVLLIIAFVVNSLLYAFTTGAAYED